MASKLTWTSNGIKASLTKADKKAVHFLTKTTVLYSLRTEAAAKRGRVWKDRSSNAVNGLTGTYQARIGATSSQFQINLFHKVPYGIWLEIRHGEKFAIIRKTIDDQAPKFFKLATDVIQRMFKGE